eukprot:15453524-Alexandrium_andersonii.AAC.1
MSTIRWPGQLEAAPTCCSTSAHLGRRSRSQTQAGAMTHGASPPIPGGSKCGAKPRHRSTNCHLPQRPPRPQTQAASQLGWGRRPQTQAALP